jgi:hypothetical protein
MAWLLIGLVLVTGAVWVTGLALALYGVVLLVAPVICGWHFLRFGHRD